MTRASGFWSKTAFNQYSICFFSSMWCMSLVTLTWLSLKTPTWYTHLLCMMTPPPPPSNSQTLKFIHLRALSFSWFCPPPVAAQWSFVSSWGPPPENEQAMWQHGPWSLPPTAMHIHVHTHTILTISHTQFSLPHLHNTQCLQSNTLCVSHTHTISLSVCLTHTHTHKRTHTHTHTHTQFQYKTKKQNRAQLTWWYTTTNKHMQNASHRKWQAQTHRKISPHPSCGNVRGPLQTTLQHYYLLSMNHANSV